MKGMEAGRAAHAIVARHSENWRRRRVPVYIRESLMVPYFVAEKGDEYVLMVLTLPSDDETDKVRFEAYASVSRHEQTPSFFNRSQPSSPAG